MVHHPPPQKVRKHGAPPQLTSAVQVDVQKLLQHGVTLHQQGSLDAASAAYEGVLEMAPKQFDALHLLGVVAAQRKESVRAIDYFNKALAVFPAHAAAHNNLGNALKELRRFDEALSSYQKAISISPGYAEAHYNSGNTYRQLGKMEQALSSYGTAIAIKSDYADALNNLGNLLKVLGRFGEALANYEKVLTLRPHHAEAHINRGNALKELGRLDEALASFDAALVLKPACADAYNNSGNVLQEQGKLDDALASYDKALLLRREYAEAHNNRGNVLKAQGRPNEALDSYDTAIALSPVYADAYVNRGNTLQTLQRLDEAVASYDRALALRPEHVDARWNKSLALLLMGNFDPGWELHESRQQLNDKQGNLRDFSAPLWLGKESLKGKNILLHAEQGLGDSIQFCRYAKLVSELGGQVLLEVPSALTPLFEGLSGVTRLVSDSDDKVTYDYHCPLMSLPLAFQTTLTSIPAPAPYLKSEQRKSAHWNERLGRKTKLRVGLVWSGNAAHLNDQNRSLTLAQLIPALPGNCEFICLQKEVRPGDAELLQCSAIRHFGAELKDFSDTAALCECLDMVVSVDTSVAHLAGALGKATWILLPFIPDWRWLLNRDDSPWYPSVKLYRQTQANDWSAVLTRVTADLEQLAMEYLPPAPLATGTFC